MHELIGRTFSLEDTHYRVVDIRTEGVDVMIYAEPKMDAPEQGYPSGEAVQKTAFRYLDIESLIEPVAQVG